MSSHSTDNPMRRRSGIILYFAGLALLYGMDVIIWFRFGMSSSLYSYTLLIPLISAYFLREKNLPDPQPPARSHPLLMLGGAAFAVLSVAGFGRLDPGAALLHPRLVMMILFLIAGLFLHGGGEWLRARLFPLLFLFAMIPLPPAWENGLNVFLQRTSGIVAYYMIAWTGTPILREGQFLTLPGLYLEVAEACSGIRSSIVLLVTSTLGSYLFLRNWVSRGLFVLAVIPIAIVRNALRILVLAWLTVHVDASIIHGPLHRRGGPLFFALSLVVLLGWLWLLRSWELRTVKNRRTR